MMQGCQGTFAAKHNRYSGKAERMKPFLSTVTNKIDSKGRVSLPANFRSVVKEEGFSNVVCFPSFSECAIEGCSNTQIELFSNVIDQMPPFSAERDALAASILGKSHDIGFDQEGRMKIPDLLIEHARIDNEVLFIGLGQKFQIWNPNIYRETEIMRSDLAKENRERLTFRSESSGHGGNGNG